MVTSHADSDPRWHRGFPDAIPRAPPMCDQEDQNGPLRFGCIVAARPGYNAFNVTGTVDFNGQTVVHEFGKGHYLAAGEGVAVDIRNGRLPDAFVPFL